MLCRAFMIEGETDFESSFKDIISIEDWAMPYMASLSNKGYLKGDKNRLNPTSGITRAETLTLLDNITGELLNKDSYSQLNRDGLTIITGNTTITDSVFDGNVITIYGANVHFVNCEIKGTLIAQSPAVSSVKLENTTYGKLDAKNAYTVEIIEVEAPQETPVEPEKEPSAPPQEKPEEEYYYIEEPVDAPPEEVAPDYTKTYVTLCVEAFTVGGGYIIDPVKAEYYEGENVAYILDRVLTENELSYINTGSLDSGYYLSQINNLHDFTFTLPDVIRENLEMQGYEITDAPLTENALGEFDFTQGSGWMYSINNTFPDVGMCDYYPENGDVIRIVFTTSYGCDIGGNNFDEYDQSNDFFERVDRDAITRAIAEQGIEAFADYMDIITNPDVTQEELDQLL